MITAFHQEGDRLTITAPVAIVLGFSKEEAATVCAALVVYGSLAPGQLGDAIMELRKELVERQKQQQEARPVIRDKHGNVVRAATDAEIEAARKKYEKGEG